MKVVILAAGTGTRINRDRMPVAKPMYKLGKKTLIEHVIGNFKKAGIREFVVVVGYKADDIIHLLGDGLNYGISIKYAVNHQYQKPLGLSLLCAEKHIDGPFLISMSDHIIDFEGVKKIVDHPLEKDSCMLLVDKKIDTIFWLDDAAKVKLEGNLIKGVSKKFDSFGAVDCGVFKCSPIIFDEIRKETDHPDSISAAVTSFSQRGKMFAVDIGEYRWIDIDEYSELEAAREIFKKIG